MTHENLVTVKESSVDQNEAKRLLHMHRIEKLLAVSYTHLRAHETVLDLVCRLLLEKKKQQLYKADYSVIYLESST